MIKYTKEKLEEAVKNASSIAHTMRNLGITYISGGLHSHIKSRITEYKIDTSHFLGQAHNKGKKLKTAKTAEQILKPSSYRVKHHLLKRALIEEGIDYICSICRMPPVWMNNIITLEIDHIDGDYKNNNVANLRFLCPNCHSQTTTYGNRASVAQSAEATALDTV